MKLFRKLALIAAFTSLSLTYWQTKPIFAATFTVTNTLDSGEGSLRQAIIDANANSGDDIIEFLIEPDPLLAEDPLSAYQAISLTSGELSITDNLFINGFGSDLLSIYNDFDRHSFDIFNIASGVNVGMSGFSIGSGYNGILNNGTLSLVDIQLGGNFDGIHNNGTATVTSSMFSGNQNSGIFNNSTAVLVLIQSIPY